MASFRYHSGKMQSHRQSIGWASFILLYPGEFSWIECLALYRSKDVVEKGFDVLKNDIDLMPANLRTNSSLRGYLFISFLALILRMKLMRMMIDARLNKKYSAEGLLTELEKIKTLVLLDGVKNHDRDHK